MTSFTKKKARNIIDTKRIMQIDENTYKVESSTLGKLYIISNGICECVGFKFRGECSHVQAVKMLQLSYEKSKIVSTS